MSTERTAEEIFGDLAFRVRPQQVFETAVNYPEAHSPLRPEAKDIIWEAVRFCLSRRIIPRYAQRFIGVNHDGEWVPITNLELGDLVLQLIALSITPEHK